MKLAMRKNGDTFWVIDKKHEWCYRHEIIAYKEHMARRYRPPGVLIGEAAFLSAGLGVPLDFIQPTHSQLPVPKSPRQEIIKALRALNNDMHYNSVVATSPDVSMACGVAMHEIGSSEYYFVPGKVTGEISIGSVTIGGQ